MCTHYVHTNTVSYDFAQNYGWRHFPVQPHPSFPRSRSSIQHFDDCDGKEDGDDDKISENIQTSLHLNIQSLLAVSFVVLISSKRYSSRHSLGKTTWFPVRRDTRFVAKTNGFLSHRVCISYLLTFVFSQADKFRFIRAEKLELVEHGAGELRSFIS